MNPHLENLKNQKYQTDKNVIFYFEKNLAIKMFAPFAPTYFVLAYKMVTICTIFYQWYNSGKITIKKIRYGKKIVLNYYYATDNFLLGW